jgi:hypothetical protein
MTDPACEATAGAAERDHRGPFRATTQSDSWRWTIEVTFHDTKTHPGITEPQDRTMATPNSLLAPLGFMRLLTDRPTLQLAPQVGPHFTRHWQSQTG